MTGLQAAIVSGSALIVIIALLRAALRRHLEQTGAKFVSQTDTEVIAHLLNWLYDGDMKRTLIRAMGMLEGSYALGILCDHEPGDLYCARNDSPLVVGARDGEGFIASDIPALLSHTRDVIFLQDKEIAVLNRQGISVFDAYGNHCHHPVFHVDWDLTSAEKGGYAHYMLKEIHEQPEAARKTAAPRLDVPEENWLPIRPEEAKRLKKITIVACGTAYHAGIYGQYAIEKLARIPVEAAIASEYRYRDPIIGEDELFIAVSQSGETADTLAALRLCKERGVRTVGIVNVVGSSIAREADATMYTWAGPEISVATTKAYSTQLAACYLLATEFARVRGTLADGQYEHLVTELEALPEKIEKTLADKERIQWFASKYANAKDAFFIGRGLDYAVALEGSLKFKEISYIHSEAFAAGEMKHGPISLVENGTLVVGILTQPDLFEKSVSNMVEVKSRGAFLMGLTTYGNYSIEDTAGFTVYVPKTDPHFATSLSVIPLQLLAYYVSCAKGLDVDKPRNLAKSVTVE